MHPIQLLAALGGGILVSLGLTLGWWTLDRVFKVECHPDYFDMAYTGSLVGFIAFAIAFAVT